MNKELTKKTLPSVEQAQTNKHLITYLQQRARSVLDQLIPDGSNVVLLDYPNNSNVGDSLIWLGEVKYLQSRNITPRYVCDMDNYNAKKLEKIIDDRTIILMHGGGNFGTIWPKEQAFREQVLKDFRGVKTIQLPQTITFENKEKTHETAKVISAHGNYTILTRGIPSFEFASQVFDANVQLSPDMAFFIGAIERVPEPLFDRFVLSRTDHEKASNWIHDLAESGSHLSIDVNDWLEINTYEKFLFRVEKYSESLRKHTDANNIQLLGLWNMLANIRMKRGIDLLGRGRVIITDRLHVHILSILMNKPHVVIDNAHKKIGNFHHTWTEGYPRAKFVTSASEAIQASDGFDGIFNDKLKIAE
ncbi:MAG: polysaccharide pyruvyl transferase family protein [Methylophilaceae bacterium]